MREQRPSKQSAECGSQSKKNIEKTLEQEEVNNVKQMKSIRMMNKREFTYLGRDVYKYFPANIFFIAEKIAWLSTSKAEVSVDKTFASSMIP